MANCLKTISYNVVIGAFVASAIVSISISGWQYTSNDNGNRWTLNGEEVDFVKDICGGWPYEYIRRKSLISLNLHNRITLMTFRIDPTTAFSVSCDGCDKPSYCGYNDGSTGYRIGIAGATGIIAILMALKKFDDQPFALWITLLLNAVFWGAAFVIDCAIVSNAALACTNSAAWANDEKCSNTKYGESWSYYGCLFVQSC